MKLLRVTAAILFLKKRGSVRTNFTPWRTVASTPTLATDGADAHNARTAIGPAGAGQVRRKRWRNGRALSEPVENLIGPEPLEPVQCLVEHAKLVGIDAANRSGAVPSAVIAIAGPFSAARHAVTILRKVDDRNHRDFATQ